MRKLFASIVALALLACALLPTSSYSQGRGPAAAAKFRRVGKPIANQYIVVFEDKAVGRNGVAAAAQALARAHGGEIIHIYEHALKGFAVKLPEAAAQALSRNPQVKYVEEDTLGEVVATQFNPPNWGLDRIDQRDRPVDGQYNYNSSGTGVWVYVIDTGIRSSHSDFGGRSWLAADYIHDGCEDCNGHGTHVAGIIGSATYGVAKNSYPLAVKVCNSAGQCNASTVIAGINYVTMFKQNWPTIPAVANISLRFSPNTSMDNAVRNSLAAGVTYTIAAGNETQNAANNTPARVSEALTVAASDFNDQRAWFSNFGSVVDLFAPGFGIVSTYNRSNTDSAELSGTSMAAPHVAGVAALYLEGRTDRNSMSPITVNQIIKANATLDHISDAQGSPNRLLYSLFAPAPTNPIDDQRFFVWQHYLDLLLREPENNGLAVWTGVITQCGADPACINTKRVEVSYNLMRSTEFWARTDVNLEGVPFGTTEYNQEFIRLCYMVYLARCVDPSDGGYQFWLNILEERRQQRGNVEQDYKDMVNAFLSSTEYRDRFYGNTTAPASGARCFPAPVCDPWQEQNCYANGGSWDPNSCFCDYGWGGGCGPGVICQ
jgi:hypothetical protein